MNNWLRTDLRPPLIPPSLAGDDFIRSLGSHAAEWRSLLREPNAEIFFEGMLQLGQRLEAENRLEAAGQVYTAILSDPVARAFRPASLHDAGVGVVQNREPEGPCYEEIRNRAQARLNAITGTGSSAHRAEFLLRRLAQETMEPATLVGLTAASAAFRMTRLASLSRLVGSSTVNFATRGFGARAAASLMGFGVEATVFPLASRGAAAALGQDLDWSFNQVGREIAGSFIVLGAMKLTGAAAGWASSPAIRRGVMGQGPIQQLGMFSGILLGHHLETAVGLRPHVDGATTFVDSLAMLVQFNAAGRLAHGIMGEGFRTWELGLDHQARTLATPPIPAPPPHQGGRGLINEFLLGSRAVLAFPSPLVGEGPRRGEEGAPHILMMAADGPGSRKSNSISPSQSKSESQSQPTSTSLIPLSPMGILKGRSSPEAALSHRIAAAERLQTLMPNGRVFADLIADDGYIQELLTCFGISSHPLDLASFRSGWEIARNHPRRVRETAFDVDEVILHWSLSLRDLFRGIGDRRGDARYHNISPEILRYEPFAQGPEVKLPWYLRTWVAIQGFLRGRMRQNLQFHPGLRAFQMGLRLGQDQNLVMATTGPAGRILILANEDPAMRMIYFGKNPAESVSIEEVRNSPNIYTREHLVLAMRQILRGDIHYPNDPLVRDYIRRVQRFPGKGVKLKHPAIATLLGKRPFSVLVDDSSSTFQMLSDLPGFTILQNPSKRPAGRRNFVFLRAARYLDRMSSHYVPDLAARLGDSEATVSAVLPPAESTPGGYPHQRLQIEIPWTRFAREYLLPARELSSLAEEAQFLHLPEAGERSSDSSKAKFNGSRLVAAGERLQRELSLWLEGTGAQAAVDFGLAQPLQDLAKNPDAFEGILRLYLTPREIEHLPETGRPLEARSEQFFSRVAGLVAAKQAAFRLLGMDFETHAQNLEFRLGRPFVTGEVKQRLGDRVLMVTMTRDGNAGIGIALLEPSGWASGLVRVGVDITTDRVSYAEPHEHSLAEAAYKAVFQGFGSDSRFSAHRTKELFSHPDGSYSVTGRLAQAARALNGETETRNPFPIKTFHFRIANAVVALVGIPAAQTLSTPSPSRPPPPSMPPATPSSSPSQSQSKSQSESKSASGSRLSLESASTTTTTATSTITSTSRLKPSSTPPLVESPYETTEEGFLRLKGKNLTVALLGDVAAVRTLDLLRSGHRVVVLDRDPDILEDSRRLLGIILDRGEHSDWEQRVNFIQGNWYEASAEADVVEAYYPLDFRDVPRHSALLRFDALKDFAERALLANLHARGRGVFVVSEHSDIVSDLAEVVETNPRLKVVTEGYGHRNPPLVGGYGVMPSLSVRHSWLLFGPRFAPSEEPNTALPYQRGPNGSYHLAKSGMNVAVLGDVGGLRTLQLAEQGHRVTHIDREDQYLEMAKRSVESFASERPHDDPRKGFDIEFVLGDWFQTTAQAELVEAFFPLNQNDLPLPMDPTHVPALRRFLDRAINSKIIPGGSALIVSENPQLIRELTSLVRQDPQLLLLQEKYNESIQRLPAIGGYAATGLGFEQNSWLIYRRLGQNP